MVQDERSMKLAFSTLGCPDWTLEQIISSAVACGYDGIEFRGIGEHVELYESPHFSSPESIRATRARLEAIKLEAACADSSVHMAQSMAQQPRQSIDTVKRYVDIAHQLGAPRVRVFGGATPEGMSFDEVVQQVSEDLRTCAEYAQSAGVTIVLETHDAFTSSAKVQRVLKEADHPRARALWDLHHPYAAEGETPKDSVHYLLNYIDYTHVKDSVLGEDGKRRYVLTGEGDVPLPTMVNILREIGYDGYLSFEWEKRWHPTLEDPAVAFPHSSTTIKEMISV